MHLCVIRPHIFCCKEAPRRRQASRQASSILRATRERTYVRYCERGCRPPLSLPGLVSWPAPRQTQVSSHRHLKAFSLNPWLRSYLWPHLLSSSLIKSPSLTGLPISDPVLLDSLQTERLLLRGRPCPRWRAARGCPCSPSRTRPAPTMETSQTGSGRSSR